MSYEPKYFHREHFTLYEGKGKYQAALISLLRRRGIDEGRVLDVGSGFGFFLAALSDSGYEPYGLEASPYAREQAQGFTEAPVAVQSAEDPFPFEDDFFDAITMFDVIEHVADYGSMLAECKRTLRPGGCICIATPSGHSIARFLLGKRWSWHKDPTHVHMFTPGWLRKSLGEAGFDDVETKTFFNFYIVGDATTALRPFRRLARFVSVPVVGDTILAMGRA